VIRDALKSQLDLMPAQERLNWILNQISTLSMNASQNEALRIFSLVLFGLAEDHASLELTGPQIQNLSDVATGALMTLGVGPRSGSASKLFSYLFLALSKSQRLRGQHWRSLWDLQLAEELAIDVPERGTVVQSLAFGFRALRLGHAELAGQHFVEVANRSAGTDQILARLAYIKCLRLSGNVETSSKAADELILAPELKAAVTQELEWEVLCRDVKRSGSLAAICDAVQRDASHFQATYFVEAVLWTYASSDRRWAKRLMKVRYLSKDKNFKPQQEGPAYQLARVIENCHDDSIDLLKRIDDLGKIVSELDQQLGVDRVLLGYAAAARWLSRTDCSKLASIAIAEYRGLSLKLSSGRDSDVLGIMVDLV
jgi:hypothetical protein